MNNKVYPTTILIFFIAFLVFFCRPFALGVDYGILALCLIIPFSMFIYSNTVKDAPNNLKVLKVILFFTVLFSIRTLEIKTVLQAFINIFTIYFLTSNILLRRKLFHYFKNFVLCLIVLAILNFILDFVVGYDRLILVSDIELENKTYRFDLYFPLTWSSMVWPSLEGVPLLSVVHPRQYFFFIEPGMVPPFFISLIYIVWHTPGEKNRIFQTVLLLIGILLTFSTGGPLMLFASFAVYYFFSQKRKFSFKTIIMALAIVLIAYIAYNYMPVFGKVDKVELSSAAAESVDIHENILGFVIYGTFITGLIGLVLMKYKQNKTAFMAIVSLLCLGYLSNYIGFTYLYLLFLFWDEPVENRLLT